MIESIKLIRFKQFKETEIQLRPFSILMGENNSGKTTVLQAIWLALHSLHQGKLMSVDFRTGQTKVSSTGYYLFHVPFISQEDLNGLFYNRISRGGQTYDENSGAIFQLRDDRKNCISLHLRELFKNLNFKLLTPAEELDHPVIQNQEPLYLSGFSGLGFQEERMFPAVLESRIANGDISSIVRNIVLDLKIHAPKKFRYLDQLLEEEFGFKMKEIHFQENHELYVFSEYEEIDRETPVSLEFGSCGSGILQILQTIAVILRYCPEKTKVVLIDEPEAHLHGNLQVRFCNILMRLQQELGIQIILSTHSEAILRNADPEHVIPVLSDVTVNTSLASGIAEYSAESDSVENTGRSSFAPDLAEHAKTDVVSVATACGGELYAGFAKGMGADSDFPDLTEKEIEREEQWQCFVERLDAFDLGRAKMSGKIAFFEGLNLELFEKMAERAQADRRSSLHTIPMIAIKESEEELLYSFSRRLMELVGRKIEVHVICPCADMTNIEREDQQDRAASCGVKLHLLSGRTMEEYLLTPELILRTLQDLPANRGRELPTAEEIKERLDVSAERLFLWLGRQRGLRLSRRSVLENFRQEDLSEELRELLAELDADPAANEVMVKEEAVAPRKEEYEQLSFMNLQ